MTLNIQEKDMVSKRMTSKEKMEEVMEPSNPLH